MFLLKGGRVIDPGSNVDDYLDVLIDGEKIVKIGKKLQADAEVINAEGLVVAPGFIDVHCHFRDPGQTHKEDLNTGAMAAAKGGYTTVVCMANTSPVVDNQEILRYVLEKARKLPIEVLQVAAVTKNLEGKELTDMRALKETGAVGFSDDGKSILNPDVALEAMRKALELDVPLSFHEEDPRLIGVPGINEGPIAKQLGLCGAMRESEDVLVARDVVLALSTGARVHIQHLSSKTSVDIIRWAKSKGARVTAEVTPHHFSFTEEMVLSMGTNAKMNPPLRTEEDRKALLEGLRDGTIEIIATDHAPHSAEEKSVDFEKAPSGVIGLETALSAAITFLVKPGLLSLNEVLKKLTVNPAKLYSLDRGCIKEGSKADLVLFDPDEKWVVQKFASKSANSPFLGMSLYGRVKMTICGGKIVYEDIGEQGDLQ
ncbi:MAG: dihydroorotase [Thermosediminibacteraceae bacterium]|nr:dihydroorotase [Thermosediminibacteraceae bacterium]